MIVSVPLTCTEIRPFTYGVVLYCSLERKYLSRYMLQFFLHDHLCRLLYISQAIISAVLLEIIFWNTNLTDC